MKEEGVRISNFQEWKKYFYLNKFGILISVLFFVLIWALNYLTGHYVDTFRGTPSPDLILDNLPVFQIGIAFVISIIAIILFFVIYPLFFKIEKFAYTLNQLSFLLLIRNIFLILTPLQGRIEAAAVKFPIILESWNYNNDLFFSGHVAIPFIGFFLYKESKIKWLFLALTIIMAAIVLMTHRHYSIDVFGGMFIAYGSYKLYDFINQKLFKNK